jgi:hypothetical protein
MAGSGKRRLFGDQTVLSRETKGLRRYASFVDLIGDIVMNRGKPLDG